MGESMGIKLNRRGCKRKWDSGQNLSGLIPGSAGVPPAGIGNSHGVDSKGEAGETPALPGTFPILFESHFQLHTNRQH
jgi:hypothetical protein